MVNIYIFYEICLWPNISGADFALGNSLFGGAELNKMLILISINILAMVLELIHIDSQIAVGLIKT